MAYLAILVPRTTSDSTKAVPRPGVVAERRGKLLLTVEERERQAAVIAKQFFAKLDSNDDGHIARSETSQTFRAFAWRVFDKDQDDELSWEEVLQQARLSLRP